MDRKRKLVCSLIKDERLVIHVKQSEIGNVSEMELLQSAISSMRKRGLTSAQMMAACQLEIDRQCRGTLTVPQWNALREPSAKHNAEQLERMVAEGLSDQYQIKDGLVRCTFDRVSGRTARREDTVYVFDFDDADQLAEQLAQCPFLNTTRHNLGFDVGVLTRYKKRDQRFYFALHQVKMGATPIGCAQGASNSNSSMLSIADKFGKIEEIITNSISDAVDGDVVFERVVDTTRPVIDNARRHAHHTDVEIVGPTKLWDEIWRRPVRNGLVAIYGQEKAPTMKH